MATAKGLTADLLAARREGLSFAAIGERFGITKQAAWERVTRAEKAAASPFERVVELRNAGKTAKQIEKKTGLTHAVVLKHISAGIAAGRIASRVVSRREREPEILALREAGKSQKEIAVELGISRNTVNETVGLAIERGRARKLSSEERFRLSLAGKAKAISVPAEPEIIAIPPTPPAAARPSDAIVLAVIQRDGIDAAQDRWPGMTIAELQRIKNASSPPPVITEADIAGVEAYLAGKAQPAAATHTLPADFDPSTVNTATAGDVIAVIERPITERPATVEVKPRPAPALNAAYVAEVYNRHGLDEVRRRWPEASDDALDAAIRVGRRMVAPPNDDLPKGWSTRIAGAIARLFGRRS